MAILIFFFEEFDRADWVFPSILHPLGLFLAKCQLVGLGCGLMEKGHWIAKIADRCSILFGRHRDGHAT